VNLTQLQASIQAKGYPSDTASAAQQLDALNGAYREICGMRRWPFLEKQDATLVTVAGTPDYTVPMTDWRSLDAVRIELVANSWFADLEYAEPQDFRDMEHIDRDTARPAYWTWINQQLRFYPTPDANYTVRIDYVMQPPDLAVGADVPVVVGGIIPEADVAALKEAGVAAVYTPKDFDLTRIMRDIVALVAYHLALDAHPDVGNNALLCRLLGLDDLEEFGQHGDRTIGFIARSEPPITLDELVARVRKEVSPKPLVFAEGPDAIARVAIISGAAAGELQAAADGGAYCFITGEPREPAMDQAREAGIHFIAAGHYATEVFGVRVLGDLIAGRFGVEHVFIDLPNPI